MKCLSFGYWILLIILFNIFFEFTDVPAVIRSVVSLGIFVWFVAGFFVKCDA
jgi:hypothetical protein